MLVSHPKKFIYLKTKKTAGSSIEVALQKYCAPAEMLSEREMAAVETAQGIVGGRGRFRRPDNWFAHMPAKLIRDRLPAPVWESYLKVCNIRNPWDKTVSFFHFHNRQVHEAEEAEKIAAFRAWLETQETLPTDRDIYFLDGRPIADFYIRYEYLAEDLAALCRRLDLYIPVIPRLKVKPRGIGQTPFRGITRTPYQRYYSPSHQQRVAKAYDLEIDHFGWSFEDGGWQGQPEERLSIEMNGASK